MVKYNPRDKYDPDKRCWDTFFRSCLRPRRLRDAVHKPSAELLKGLSNFENARTDLTHPVIVGVPGGRSTYAQVQTYNLFLCQNMHHFVGPAYKSERQYVLRLLRPELRTQFGIIHRGRRQGKTLVMANNNDVLLRWGKKGIKIRHYAKAQDQSYVILVYMIGIMKERKLALTPKITKDCIALKHANADPSTIHSGSITEQERGKPCDAFSGDEYVDYDPPKFASVGMGMVNPEDTTMTLFSTQKPDRMEGLKDLSSEFDGDLEPDIAGYSDEGICQNCQNTLKPEFAARCWHMKYLEGTWTAQSKKAGIISRFIAYLGLDAGVFNRETLNIMTRVEKYVITSRDMIPRCFVPHPFLQSHPTHKIFHIRIGIDFNGGSETRDRCGMFAMIYGSFGFCQIVGIALLKVGNLERETAAFVRQFIDGLRIKYRTVPIIVQAEAQPPGWANVAMNACMDMTGVFFLGNKRKTNDGIGIPLGNQNKKMMAVMLNARVSLGITLAKERFIFTNVTEWRLPKQAAATTAEEYVLRKTQAEFENLQYITDPRTHTVSVSGKGMGTDDNGCAAMHCEFGGHLLRNLDAVGAMLYSTYRGSIYDEMVCVEQGSRTWVRLVG